MPSKLLLSEAAGPSLEGLPTTVYEMMRTASLDNPENTAINSMHQPPDLYPDVVDSKSQSGDYLKWSHSEFRQQAELLALGLDSLGLRKGEPIAIFLHNVDEWSLFLYATLLLNVPFVKCNPRSAQNADEVKHVIKTSGARALVTTDKTLAAQLEAAASGELKNMKFKIVVANDTGHLNGHTDMVSTYPLGSLLLKAKSQSDIKTQMTKLQETQRLPEDTILILSTGGTTSLPKGCEHTNKTFTANLKSYMASLEVATDSFMCMNHALNSVSGPLFNFSFLAFGATVVHSSMSFDAAASIQAVQTEKCSHMGTSNYDAAAVLRAPLHFKH